MSRVRNCARQDRGRQVHPAQLRCVRKPPCPPWQQIRAIQAIAQQFTALRLAQAAAALARGAEAPAGWLPTHFQHCRRTLDILVAGTAPRGAKTMQTATLLVARLRTRGLPHRSGNVTTGRHALAISLLSSHPRAHQAASSIDIPRFQGYHLHLTRKILRRTGALAGTTEFYNMTERSSYEYRSQCIKSEARIINWFKLRKLANGNHGIFAGPHRYNYARSHCCAAVVSFALCALSFSNAARVFQASNSATTQALTLYTLPKWWCGGMHSWSACQNSLTLTINSSVALQMRLACALEFTAALADKFWTLLNLLSVMAVIASIASLPPFRFDNGQFPSQLNGALSGVRHWLF
ncbi:hypothetical protein SVAN01_01010 [Stagonosporopsis vannaccii]|nr:hypothetical protein SVAN01_01010 [Stagonosporopsis vannaccii]